MWIHSFFVLFVPLIFLFCIYFSFELPWVRPLVPISHGWYAINIPMDIGLLKCFSDICKEYEEVDQFLSHGKILWIESTSSPSFRSSFDSLKNSEVEAVNQQNFAHNQLVQSQKSIQNSLTPYKTASGIVLISYIPTIIGSVLLILLFLYETSNQVYLLSNNLKNILLLVTTFSLFLGVVGYLFLTYFHLNGGIYLEGIWMMSYASIIGLLSCLFVHVLENSYETERIHQSVEYYHRNTPQRKYYQCDEREAGAASHQTDSFLAPPSFDPSDINIYQTPPRKRPEIP